ncbi:MAG TPA: tripartite tricarboxylate transporter substrate-binding protein, partial [Burkholderiales bacterium]
MTRLSAAACMLLLAASVAHSATSAPSYPLRPVRLIVPYSAGGSSDALARIVAQRVSERLGQQLVVDNRAGAGTLIGTEIAARAAADGYTLLVATPPLVINPTLYAKATYAPERDFAAVTNMAASSNVLVVHPALPASSVKELVALLRSQPGRHAYG